MPNAVHMVVSRWDRQIYFYDGNVTLNPSTGTYVPIISIDYQWFRNIQIRPTQNRR